MFQCITEGVLQKSTTHPHCNQGIDINFILDLYF